MTPSGIEQKQLARAIASHKRLKDSYFDIEIKPARKGEIFGKGGKGKKPRFDFRITFKVSDEFKKIVKKELDLII